MVPVSHNTNCSVTSILDFPRDIRFPLLDLLGCEKGALEITCRFFWNERHVRLISNPASNLAELGKYLSWIIYQNKPELLNDFTRSPVPIKLELPLYIGDRKECVKKVLVKFPNVESVTILQKNYPHKALLKNKKTDLDELCHQLSALTLNSTFSAKEIMKFHIPHGIKKLAFIDPCTRKARNNNEGEFTDTPPTGQFLFQSKRFDLFTILCKCPQLEELTIAGGGFQSLFCKLPATLRHLSLAETEIISAHLGKIYIQCPGLQSVDIMWNRGISENYSHYDLGLLKHLERFTISRKPTKHLFYTLANCNLLSVVVEHAALTDKWLDDTSKPFISKLPEIIVNKSDREHPIVRDLQEKYPHLKISIKPPSYF